MTFVVDFILLKFQAYALFDANVFHYSNIHIMPYNRTYDQILMY